MNSFESGFIKRAKAYGLDEKQAKDLLVKYANFLTNVQTSLNPQKLQNAFKMMGINSYMNLDPSKVNKGFQSLGVNFSNMSNGMPNLKLPSPMPEPNSNFFNKSTGSMNSQPQMSGGMGSMGSTGA